MFVRAWPFAEAMEHYIMCGRSALRVIRLALAAAECPKVERILDFPCGYGRVLRVLATAYPEAELHASDLNTAGVEFCAKNLKAVPITSHVDPAKVRLQGPYDIIWVGSLFTHFDAPRWRDFFTLFQSALRVGGVCVFTTHGRRAAELMRTRENVYGLKDPDVVLRKFDSSGFVYRAYSAADPGYGISLSSVSWVTAELGKLTNARTVLSLEKGWANHQDVFAWQRTG
jgi:cyclopropane fatty-acyl-phospholipid synthase-like methyltransferase